MAEELSKQCAAKVMDTCYLILRAISREISKRSPQTLSTRQVLAMMVIRDEDGVSLSYLSEQIGGTISGASKLVDNLVERGYVERATAGQDRRKLTLALTPAGKAALNAAGIAELDFMAEKMSALTAGERSMVNLTMELLREAFAES